MLKSELMQQSTSTRRQPTHTARMGRTHGRSGPRASMTWTARIQQGTIWYQECTARMRVKWTARMESTAALAVVCVGCRRSHAGACASTDGCRGKIGTLDSSCFTSASAPMSLSTSAGSGEEESVQSRIFKGKPTRCRVAPAEVRGTCSTRGTGPARRARMASSEPQRAARRAHDLHAPVAALARVAPLVPEAGCAVAAARRGEARVRWRA